MRFGHLELSVADPRRSLAFWSEVLGFRLVSEQGPYLWIEREGLEILLRPGTPGAGVGLVFYTEDPARFARALSEGGVEHTSGSACVTVHDPDGYEIQVVDPRADHSGSG